MYMSMIDRCSEMTPEVTLFYSINALERRMPFLRKVKLKILI